MITEFCMNCGAKIEYALHKPNFCSSCGNPLGGTAKASIEPAQEKKEEASDESFSRPSKLDYSINTDQNKITFGDLVAKASQDNDTEYKKDSVRPKANFEPGEDVVKSTMQQCRSRKDPDDISD